MAPTDAQLALQNPQPQPLRVKQVSGPGTPLVDSHPAAQGHGASGSWAPAETMNSMNAESQPGQMRRLQPGEDARPGAGSPGGLGDLAGKVENLTAPIENYTEAGREAHPILSRVGDITRGAKELLVGHQTPMGAQSGILTNPVTAAIVPEDIALMQGKEGMAAEGTSAEKKAIELAQKAAPVVKKGANAVVDALAHPTAGVSPAELNPEAGVLRVKNTKPAIEPAQPYSATPEERVASQAHETPPTHSTETVHITPQDFIEKVGPGPRDAAKVENIRQAIRNGDELPAAKISFDQNGNVTDADGRHRATAHMLEGTERMPVEITRKLPTVTPAEAPAPTPKEIAPGGEQLGVGAGTKGLGKKKFGKPKR